MTKRVLNWVNGQRIKLGGQPLSEIPKGERQECLYCPLANAFRDVIPPGVDGVAVDGTAVHFGRLADFDHDDGTFGRQTVKTIKFPGYVTQAVGRFDEERYPHLELT